MTTTLKEKIKGLRADRRRTVEERVSQLAAEEMTLQELRRARQVEHAPFLPKGRKQPRAGA